MDKGATTLMATAIDRLADVARRALRPSDLDSVRGLEGEAAHIYFSVFSHLLRTRDTAIRFEGLKEIDPARDSLRFYFLGAKLETAHRAYWREAEPRF
jgi:CRISP-associated protein Cas1